MGNAASKRSKSKRRDHAPRAGPMPLPDSYSYMPPIRQSVVDFPTAVQQDNNRHQRSSSTPLQQESYPPPLAELDDATTQMTVSSRNQLTATSLRSLQTANNNKPFDLDDCIARLVEVGQQHKYTKTVCLKQSEMLTICRAAHDIFMSQPVCYPINIYMYIRTYIYIYTYICIS